MDTEPKDSNHHHNANKVRLESEWRGKREEEGVFTGEISELFGLAELEEQSAPTYTQTHTTSSQRDNGDKHREALTTINNEIEKNKEEKRGRQKRTFRNSVRTTAHRKAGKPKGRGRNRSRVVE